MSRLWLIIVLVFLIDIDGINGIINGQKACQGQFPYVAGIWKLQKSICGGSIINERHILTAAHCIEVMTELECTVTVGSTDLRTPLMRIGASQFYPHPNFRRMTDLDKPGRRMIVNDIAIIKLARDLEWGPYVQPIALRRQPGFSTCGCYIAGWGYTDRDTRFGTAELRWTKLFVPATRRCHQNVRLFVNEACLVDPRSMASSGPGDSGGPVICNGVLVGVITAGLVRMYTPSAFLRIHPYLQFIDQVLSYTPPRPTAEPNVFEFLNQEGLLCP